MKWAKSKDEIVVYDSGGSCIVAMKYIDECRYYVCNSADYDMTLFDDTDEDTDCYNVISSTWSPDERTPEEQKMYELLNQAIDDFINKSHQQKEAQKTESRVLLENALEKLSNAMFELFEVVSDLDSETYQLFRDTYPLKDYRINYETLDYELYNWVLYVKQYGCK